MKYGALSGADGRVDISWRVAKDSDRSLELVWSESGGPPVRAPTRKGFGSRLIESVMTAELGVSASVDYAPAGVIWRIAVPLARVN